MPEAQSPLFDAPERPASRTVLIRDLIFFQIKLWLDGVKDIVLSPLSIIGAGIDILSGRSGKKSLFYKVLRLGERFDLWLNLYGPAREAATDPDGLLARRGLRSRDIIEQIDRASDTDRRAIDEPQASPPSRTT